VKIFHSEGRSGSRRQLNVYSDPKHWWMLHKNHLKNFYFWRKASRTQKYLQKHGQKRKLLQKPSREQNFFTRKQKFLRQLSRKASQLSLIFAFRENEKRVFNFNPKAQHFYSNISGKSEVTGTRKFSSEMNALILDTPCCPFELNVGNIKNLCCR
jgi:hypothetical protein